ncbi:MAG TPA: deoxyribonuclease IV [Fimbriiglobus sp.]|jgi:deoxyribonuclease-4
MPLFGAHLSIAGGLFKAAETAKALDCETVQIFSKNASQWKAKPLTSNEIAAFKAAIKTAELKFPTAHDSYLINLAAPGDELYRKSIDAFVDEVERAEALGLAYLVMHPGAHVGSGEDAGLARVAAGFDEVHTRCSGFKVKVLIEITAGQGTTLGYKFDHVAAIRKRLADADRVGVCFDTCHAFAAGYPLWPEAEYDATFQKFDETIGLNHLKAFHVNDSVKGLGSRVDRHAGIGLGQIPEATFARLVNDKRFAKHPMILETPKEAADGTPMDPVNLGKLREFCRG